MRVIAGDLRSRKLHMVDSKDTRETKDRVKESIFNMIGPYQDMDTVLDLFAGSGSLGIEACSRGAKEVVFVDQMAKAVQVVKTNVEELKIRKQATIKQMDALVFLTKAKSPFDLIFLDPPYHRISLEVCIQEIEEKGLLTKDGLIVLLSDQDTTINETDRLIITKKKRITRTNVTFMKWRN